MGRSVEGLVSSLTRRLRGARRPEEAGEAFVASLSPFCSQRFYAVYLLDEAAERFVPTAWRLPGNRRPTAAIDLGLDPEPVLREQAGIDPSAPLRAFPLYLDASGTLVGLFACGGSPCPFCTGPDALCGALADVLALHLRQTREVNEALRREAREADLRRAVVESLPAAVARCDADDRVLAANAMFAQAAGAAFAEGRKITEILDAAFEGVDLPKVLDAARKGSRVFLPRVRHGAPGTKERTVSLWVNPVRDSHLTPAALLAVFDVTREAAVEQALVRAQRMESLGTLAAGMAHEFKNYLSVILGNAELLLLQADRLGPDAVRRLHVIVDTCEKAASVAHSALRFGRRTEPERRPVDLAALAARVATLASPSLPKRVALKVDATPGTTVSGDEQALEQMLLNLVLNGAEAVGECGTVAVGVRPLGEDQAAVAVADDGPGMDPDTAARVFEPFFTTKPEGEGTGLGLSVAYGIARDHGGAIDLDTAPGQGATFRVILPMRGRDAAEG
ncbi:MAG: hypothetical protein Kow0092_16400 [Deferrisomatales bacterium]